jgi:hypothetical protein
MANPNIVNTTTIFGNTATQVVSTTTANIVQNATGTNSVYKINLLSISNISTNAYSITAEFNVANANTYIARNIVVPANSALSIIGKDTAMYMLENSSIQLTASTNSAFNAICSWEQIS